MTLLHHMVHGTTVHVKGHAEILLSSQAIERLGLEAIEVGGPVGGHHIVLVACQVRECLLGARARYALLLRFSQHMLRCVDSCVVSTVTYRGELLPERRRGVHLLPPQVQAHGAPSVGHPWPLLRLRLRPMMHAGGQVCGDLQLIEACGRRILSSVLPMVLLASLKTARGRIGQHREER